MVHQKTAAATIANLYIAITMFVFLTMLNAIGLFLLEPYIPANEMPRYKGCLLANGFFSIGYLCSLEVKSRLPHTWRWPLFRMAVWILLFGLTLPFFPEIFFCNIAAFCVWLVPLYHGIAYLFDSPLLTLIAVNVFFISVLQFFMIRATTSILNKIKNSARRRSSTL